MCVCHCSLGRKLEGAELSLMPALKVTASGHLVAWLAPGWARMDGYYPHYTDEQVEATGRLTPATKALPLGLPYLSFLCVPWFL